MTTCLSFADRNDLQIHIKLLFLALLFMSGCGPAISAKDLPSMPVLDVDGYQDAVAAQITQAWTQVEKQPTNAKANGHLGMLYRTYRDYEQAEILFHRARLLAPREPDWMYYHGEVLEKLAEHEGAIAAMRAVLASDDTDLPAQIHLAELLIQTGELDQAYTQLQQMVQRYPDYSAVFIALSKVHERRGDLEAAADAWQKALKFAGDFGQGHYTLAQIYRRLGRTDEADRHLLRFKTLGNTVAPILDPRLQRLSEFNVSDRPLILAAQKTKARGDNKGAIELLEQAISRNPKNLETRAALVAGYATLQMFDQAEDHYRQGAQINTDHIELNYSLGRLRQEQGRTKETQEILTLVTEQAPQNATARAWLGRAQELRGEVAAAGESYRMAVKTNPEDATARKFLTVWLLEFESYPEAIRLLTMMTQVDTSDLAMIYSAMAVLHDRNLHKEEALAALTDGIAAAKRFGQSRMQTRLSNQRAQLLRSGEQP